jgi:DNA mismatch repair protein MutS2
MIVSPLVLGKLEFDKVLHRCARHAASDPGRDVVEQLSPSTDVGMIRLELARVTEMKRLLEEEEALPLEGIHAVDGPIRKCAVEGMTPLPRELLQVGSTLRAARVVRAFLAKRRERFPLLWETAASLFADKVLEYNIDRAIDEAGAVRATASKELQAIRRAMTDRYDQLRRKLESILKTVSDLGFSQEEIITTREGRMVIPVKAEHKTRVQGFIHSASASGATVFVEPSETLELNNEIRSLTFQEQREVDRILRELAAQVAAVKDQLLGNLGLLAGLDALHARGKYSIEILGIAPEVRDSGPITLVQARHPILLMNHGYAGTVPLSLEIGRGFSAIVISGPNAGGKSVAMKCVGLLVLMAASGIHIPAAEPSALRVFRRIFVAIGDEQSIENDMSTFSSHLATLKVIADEADGQSLVLIDEIGAGTDPVEGGAIAAALLEGLVACGATTIATTHQGSLKVFAHETGGVENGAMEFDQETLRPTYRFKSGVPGSSYALEMAARLGMPQQTAPRCSSAVSTRVWRN